MSTVINAPVVMGVANKLPIGCTQTQDETPYLFRKSGGSNNANVGNRFLLNKIVGGTVAWNQICDNDFVNHYDKTGSPTVTKSGDTTTITVGGANTLIYLNSAYRSLFAQIGHKLLVFFKGYDATNKGNSKVKFSFVSSATTGTTRDYEFQYDSFIFSSISDVYGFGFYITNVTSGDSVSFDDVSVINLTAMFGSTIADYVYTLESGTAGAGIAWLKKYGYFTKPYYPYKTAALESVKTSAHKTIGFNQWDEQWEVGAINFNTGLNVSDNTRIRSKNKIPVIGGTTYFIRGARIAWIEYDANGDYIRVGYSGSYVGANATFTPSSDAYFIRFQTNTAYGTTYNHDICINVSKTTGYPKNGDYEPHSAHSYALDSTKELRGVLKKDANNNLYYDGDRYLPDGTVERKYGIVDLGTLTWTKGSGATYFAAKVSGIKRTSGWNAVPNNIICPSYMPDTPNHVAASTTDKTMSVAPNADTFIIYDSAYASSTKDQFKTAMSGVYLVYELATPTTESADAYEKMQIVSKDGTEQFVDAGERDFEVPVQHETVYPIATFDDFAYDAFPMSVEESGRTQYPMKITSQNIIVG